MKGLVAGFLEDISSEVFDHYLNAITSLIGKQHGVYALYKRRKLYYVGLATDLRNRVKHHLKDRHAHRWDTFSLYLIANAEHIKELETLVVHIAVPKGNIQTGSFRRSHNLKRELKQLMRQRSKTEQEKILSLKPSGKRIKKVGRKKISGRYRSRRRFWTTLLERAKKKTNLHVNRSPVQHSWVGTGAGKAGLGLNYVVRKHEGNVELYIDRGKDSEEENKEIFDTLVKSKSDIEKTFGAALEWQRLDGKRACRIRKKVSKGGYLDEEKWPEIQDEMIELMVRLEKALRPSINSLKI